MTALGIERRSQARGRHRRLGVVFLTVPLLVFAVFAIGEGVGAEAGWWGHLIQLGIGVALLAAGWYVPRVGGPALVLSGLALGGWIVANADDTAAGVSTVVIIALPVVVSGLFFALAGYRDRAPTDRP